MPVLSTLRLSAGRTAPDDVAALRTALAERLTLCSLLPIHDGLPASVAEGGEDWVVSPLPLLVLTAPGEDEGQVRSDLARRITRVPARIDPILHTSGSTTGTDRLVAMSAAALVASVRTTHTRFGGPGTWLLPLPAHHVVDLQTLTRSLEIGTKPAAIGTNAGFDPAALARALRSVRWSIGAAASRLYIFLAPIQLVRILQDLQACQALTGADAALLSGAAADPALPARARGVGITVVTTYGTSKASGGYVYNGRPLGGTRIAIQTPDAEGAGHTLISDPVLAEDYLDTPSHSPADRLNASEGFRRNGTRHVLTTSDRSQLHPDGYLKVLGRSDNVIIIGGAKVELRHVGEALTGIDGMAGTCVVGLPDMQWGSTVVATIVLKTRRGPGSPKQLDGTALREAAHARLDGTYALKRVLILEVLPSRPSREVDQREVARLLAMTTTNVTSELSTSGS